MRDDHLATYLQDHLAGAAAGIQLLEAMRDEHAGKGLSRFASELLVEIERDRATLQGIVDRLDAGPGALKKAAASVGATVSRLKLGRSVAGDFGAFESLEALALGILGKLALWRALAALAGTDDRLQGVEYDRLIGRAEEQHAAVEARRLEAVPLAFGADAAAA